MEDLVAEIEYIKIKGISYSPRECRKCENGIANENQTMCEPCARNHYFNSETQDCKPCKENQFSKVNQDGIQVCVERQPCNESDYYVVYG